MVKDLHSPSMSRARLYLRAAGSSLSHAQCQGLVGAIEQAVASGAAATDEHSRALKRRLPLHDREAADSLIAGDCITRLVRMMEHRPRIGILQTAPRLAHELPNTLEPVEVPLPRTRHVQGGTPVAEGFCAG
ncbi:hypothetical protein [Marinobacter lipolyticus]|uniref:hypothetical protein n=1 Tax=Marinobacter lipolyticus TaxID=209639 RepID=UPI001BD04F2D|nr:hypothetical protein [Marinobacter lipolyticus]